MKFSINIQSFRAKSSRFPAFLHGKTGKTSESKVLFACLWDFGLAKTNRFILKKSGFGEKPKPQKTSEAFLTDAATRGIPSNMSVF